jgi:hypothetical protein
MLVCPPLCLGPCYGWIPSPPKLVVKFSWHCHSTGIFKVCVGHERTTCLSELMPLSPNWFTLSLLPSLWPSDMMATVLLWLWHRKKALTRCQHLDTGLPSLQSPKPIHFGSCYLFVCLFLCVLGFELRAYTLSHSTFFVKGFFKTGSWELFAHLAGFCLRSSWSLPPE